MLFLLFQLGAERYALDARRVVEVLPLLGLRPVPGATQGVAGLFSYRGETIPAVDLSQLLGGRPARERISTRIVVVQHPDAEGKNRRLGLIAENVTQVIRKEESDCRDTGPHLGAAPYLGPALLDEQGVVRWLHEDRLLPNDVRERVFAEADKP